MVEDNLILRPLKSYLAFKFFEMNLKRLSTAKKPIKNDLNVVTEFPNFSTEYDNNLLSISIYRRTIVHNNYIKSLDNDRKEIKFS